MDQEAMDIELIEAYFNKTLTMAEAEQFEMRIKADADFAEKVDDYKDIIGGIKLKGREDFQLEVAAWETAIENSTNRKKTIHWKYYRALAAGIVLFVLAGLYFFIPRSSKNNQELFQDYFVPYEDVMSVRGDDELNGAFEFYTKGNYENTIPLFKSYLLKHPDDANVLFYEGISELALGDTNQAVHSLEQVTKLKSIFKEQAEWYLALAYLLANKTDQAIALLKNIAAQPEHDYQSKANDLLLKL